MHIVHVFVYVRAEHIEDFAAATELNAAASRKEPGIARFDVLQSRAEPSKFVLVEVYKDEQAALAHKQTSHYATWRDTVADMMQTPRSSEQFRNVSPDDSGW